MFMYYSTSGSWLSSGHISCSLLSTHSPLLSPIHSINQYHSNPLQISTTLFNPVQSLQTSANFCKFPYTSTIINSLSDLPRSSLSTPTSDPSTVQQTQQQTMGCGQSRPSYNERAQPARPKKVFVGSRSSGQVYVERRKSNKGRKSKKGRKNNKGGKKRRHH